MDDNENKKSNEARPGEELTDEELTDEELEAVAGGDVKDKLKRRIKEMLFNDG